MLFKQPMSCDWFWLKCLSTLIAISALVTCEAKSKGVQSWGPFRCQKSLVLEWHFLRIAFFWWLWSKRGERCCSAPAATRHCVKSYEVVTVCYGNYRETHRKMMLQSGFSWDSSGWIASGISLTTRNLAANTIKSGHGRWRIFEEFQGHGAGPKQETRMLVMRRIP